MEVLKTGMNNVVKCAQCGSSLRYTESDVRLNKATSSYRGYEPEDAYGMYVVCPVCPDHPKVSVPRNASLIRRRLEAERLSDLDL
jgi:hypothetical protein